MAELPLTNLVEVTVSELSRDIKRTVEDAFGRVRVRGEISGFRGPHSSGHAYFALKDEKARLEAVIWRGSYKSLPVKPEEGLEVIATGRITTYPGSSKYQIVIEHLEPAGIGALMALLEERRKKLAAEGLFDDERKVALPYLPRVIGVVTSPTGAVIRDILHRLEDRFPVQVLVWPVRVQGETSGAEVAAAVRGFAGLGPLDRVPRPDVLIVARGGGSLEDLWGFNDEAVVRAVAECTIPVISAVGHETDWTLIDYVADRRAPTPTGAAEMAVPVRNELLATVDDLARRLAGASLRSFEHRRQTLRALARALPRAEDLAAGARQRFDTVAERLNRSLSLRAERSRGRLDQLSLRLAPMVLKTRIERAGERLVQLNERSVRGLTTNLRDRRQQLNGTSKLLDSLSYRNVLARGYAVVRGADGVPISDRAELMARKAIAIEFRDGEIAATVGDGVSADVDSVRADVIEQSSVPTVEKPASAAMKTPPTSKKRAAKPTKKSPDSSSQGELF